MTRMLVVLLVGCGGGGSSEIESEWFGRYFVSIGSPSEVDEDCPCLTSTPGIAAAPPYADLLLNAGLITISSQSCSGNPEILVPLDGDSTNVGFDLEGCTVYVTQTWTMPAGIRLDFTRGPHFDSPDVRQFESQPYEMSISATSSGVGGGTCDCASVTTVMSGYDSASL